MPLRLADRARDAYDFPLTIRHLLDAAMQTAGTREIVYRDRLRLTYRQLETRIGRLAALLTTLGVSEGTTVAMLDWDSHRYLEAYFAVPMMGAVLLTANVRLPPAQLAFTLDHGAAEVLLVHRDFWPLVEALRPSLPRVRAIVAIGDGSDDEGGDGGGDGGDDALPAWADGEYETLLAAAAPDFPFRDFDENAVATTFYTTGTTGNPKGVCFTHRQLVLHTLAANAPFGATRSRGFGIDDVYMPLTPMFHVHAWGVPYIATMLGLKQVYPGRYDPDTILDLRTREGVTFSHCVPTILQMLLAAADRRGDDLAGWMMTIGGAALTEGLCAEGRRRGMEIVLGYGMSETAPTIAIAHRRPGEAEADAGEVARLTSAGYPLPLVSARIVDEEMRDLPHDGVARGELVLRAPWLTPCYTGDPAASEALWAGGWLHTQDVASIDPDGLIHIRDRLKDVIKTGGEWLCSLSLEDIVAGADGVAEVAVIGVPDAHWGERPIAVVVAQPQATVTLAGLNASIDAAIAAGTLSRYARLGAVAIVDALPRTSVGKIDKKLLRTRSAATPIDPV